MINVPKRPWRKGNSKGIFSKQSAVAVNSINKDKLKNILIIKYTPKQAFLWILSEVEVWRGRGERPWKY